MPSGAESQQDIKIFAPSLLSVGGGAWGKPMPAQLDNWQPDEWIKGILHLCLYADKVYVADPVEILARHVLNDWTVGAAIGAHRILLGDSMRTLKAAAVMSAALEPLIDAEIVVLYPPLSTYFSAVANALFGANRGFTADEMEFGWPDLYVAEGLRYAKIFEASYTALQRDEYYALQRAAVDVEREMGLSEQRILASLPRMKLPFFKHLDASSLVQARQNEESFHDFRRFLREVSMRLSGGLENPKFQQDVEGIEKEYVTPALEKLEKDITGVSSLKARLGEARIDFIAGAIAGFALKGNIEEALMTGGLGALAKALVKMITGRERVRPAASLVYAFHIGHGPSLPLYLSPQMVLDSFRRLRRKVD